MQGIPPLACYSYATASCLLMLLKSWFIYKWFVVSLRLPIWNWIQGHAVRSTKGNLLWICNQRRRRIFFINGEKQKLCGTGWLALPLVTGSSSASLLILQHHGRIWMKRCNAFSHQQDTIWVFFSGSKGSCACFCLSSPIFSKPLWLPVADVCAFALGVGLVWEQRGTVLKAWKLITAEVCVFQG